MWKGRILMRHFFILLILALALAGCSDAKSTTLSYEEIKKIMVDSIQTEDGKKAIRQLFEDESFRELLILNTEEIKKATEETLLSKEAADFWMTTFEDPKFQETFAKSMQKQQEDLMKKLLNDASYQEDLTSFFGQSDMQKQLETILKGAVMRKELEKVVMETIENPLLQSKWQELVKKSSDEQEDDSKKKDKESRGKKEDGSSQ